MYVLSCSRGSMTGRWGGGTGMLMLAMMGVPLTGPPFAFMAICICWFCMAARRGGRAALGAETRLGRVVDPPGCRRACCCGRLLRACCGGRAATGAFSGGALAAGARAPGAAGRAPGTGCAGVVDGSEMRGRPESRMRGGGRRAAGVRYRLGAGRAGF